MVIQWQKPHLVGTGIIRMIDGIGGSQITQLHALKFEAQAQQETVQQIENQTKQTIQKAQSSQAGPNNKPDHRGQIIDILA